MTGFHEILEPLSDDPQLRTLLEISVGRILGKDPGGLDTAQRNSEEIRFFADWLGCELQCDAHWLGKCDLHGRPRKLMKLGSIEACLREARKSIGRRGKRRPALQQGYENAASAGVAEGFRLARLQTPEDFDLESRQMGHCIGNGSYDKQLYNADRLYLSLRDAGDRPHATLEIEGNRLLQIKGKQNAPPVRKYLEILQNFILAQGLELDELPTHTGLVQDVAGRLHLIQSLPEGLKVDGDLHLDGAELQLPPRLTVEGNLSLRGAKLKALPIGMKIRGDLNLALTRIGRLPGDLSVGGALVVTSTDLTELPARLSVGGSLFVDRTRIADLPPDLKVGSDLDLSDTPVTYLPEGIEVGRNLRLSRTLIRRLPEGLTVRGDLDLSRSIVETLPSGLKVNGALNLVGTRIERLPEDLVVKGDILAGGTPMAFLPADLHVGGSLDIRKTPVRLLPPGLRIGGDLRIQGTAICELPDDLVVGGDLDLSGMRIGALPRNLKVGGTLNIRRTGLRNALADTVAGEIRTDRTGKARGRPRMSGGEMSLVR